MRRFLLTVVLALFLAAPGSAQDTLAPALLAFSVSPTVIDLGAGPVDVSFCATIRDNQSGVDHAQFIVGGTTSMVPPLYGLATALGSGSLEEIVCGVVTVSEEDILGGPDAPAGFLHIGVGVRDTANNAQSYGEPSACGSGCLPLCPIGPCLIENRPTSVPPSDVDGDGVPDGSDNCPLDANPTQLDTDRDLIGDACDPFPFDRDNAQAQCSADLSQAQADLASCQAQNVFQDGDLDGVEDSNDTCPWTEMGRTVDGVGCSRDEFCGRAGENSAVCRASDWRNDEPLASEPGDCAVEERTGVCGAAPDLPCDDGVDNDGDSHIDLQDPACGDDPDWPSEASGQAILPVCGLGPEVALVLPLLAWGRKRRLRAKRSSGI